MNEEQREQLVQIVTLAMLGDEEATKLVLTIMLKALEGDLLAIAIALEMQTIAQQLLQEQGGQPGAMPHQNYEDPSQSLMARLGAKLNYINYLRGKCPEGYEMRMFSKGGAVCKTCVRKQMARKAQEGNKVPMNAVDAFKCGRKMKKKKKPC